MGLGIPGKGQEISLNPMELLISDLLRPVKMAISYGSTEQEQRAWGKSMAACHPGEW